MTEAPHPSRHRAAILTVSDRAHRGERPDTAGPAISDLLDRAGYEVASLELLPDEPPQIEAQLRSWADRGIEGAAGFGGGEVALIVTTGGTGLGPRDRTPEATAAVLDYHVPGLAEAMRAAGVKSTPMAMLSRALAGVRGRTLILNLPGSERGARENLEAVLPVLSHALDQLRGGDHPAPNLDA